MSHILHLPEELLREIFSYLDDRDLKALQLVRDYICLGCNSLPLFYMKHVPGFGILTESLSTRSARYLLQPLIDACFDTFV